MNIAFITKTPDFEIDFVSIVAFHIAQKNPSANCYLYHSNSFVQLDAESLPQNLICSQKATRKKPIHFLENWKQQRHFKNLLRQQHTDILFCNGCDEIVEGSWKKIVFEGEIQSKKISKKNN